MHYYDREQCHLHNAAFDHCMAIDAYIIQGVSVNVLCACTIIYTTGTAYRELT